ncbi:MAG: sterol desaturase family protein [Verrucomicrobia bacterium]|nr:sterol desaturase family protein [Verrucomicrobiota bacterium]
MIPNDSIETLLKWRGAASLGWLVVLLAWESVAPCYGLFRSGSDRGRHAVRNLVLALVNGLAIALIFAGLWRSVATWAEDNHFGLLNQLPWPDGVRWVAAVLLLDVWTYAWHRINHRVPLLWRLHRVHHTDAQMDVTTANRFHLGEIVLSSVLRIPLILLLGIGFGELVLYETLLQVVVQWQHANIALPPRWERVVRWCLVTPGLHKVHHSRHQPETDSNYASLLPIWDFLFRSLKFRDRPEEIRLGLDGFDTPEQQSVLGLAKLPFRRDPAPRDEISPSLPR